MNVVLALANCALRTAECRIYFARIASVPLLGPGEVIFLIFVYHRRGGICVTISLVSYQLSVIHSRVRTLGCIKLGLVFALFVLRHYAGAGDAKC